MGSRRNYSPAKGPRKGTSLADVLSNPYVLGAALIVLGMILGRLLGGGNVLVNNNANAVGVESPIGRMAK